jgi:hypothetical protein
MRKDSYLKSAVVLRAVCLLFCLGCHASAQTVSPPARKFDEFGDVELTDIAARLDNFANELEAQPGTRGFIIVYRGRRDLPGLSGRLLGWVKDYLIHSRQVASGRFAGVDGGVSDCIRQELWIVPVGVVPTPRSGAYNNVFEDTDSPWKFDEAPPSTTENMGGNYTSNIFQSLEGFANALRRHPRSSAYVIAYSQYRVDEWEEQAGSGAKRTRRRVNRDPPGAAGNEMTAIKAALVSKYKISQSRIKLLNGGYRKWGHVELWIVPRGEHAPIPTPNAFPRGRR